MKFDRSVWLFLVIGIAMRCVAINQPLLDAHLIRQCQTAAATKSLMAEPGFHLSSRIPWLGDLDGHYILELPIYNYLVMGVHCLTGNLDFSGKLTSILLWAASFVCLQFIWRRVLDSTQAFWANLLFLIAPLSMFFGQAFMPEMLIQLLALAFIWQLLRYDENPSNGQWILVASLGLIALLVKLPETAHLYLILGFLVFRREGWKALLRPRYLLAAMITFMALKGWGRYVDSVNAAYLPEWTSSEGLRHFVGSLGSRLKLQPWIMASLYVGAFIVPGPAAAVAVYGMWIFLHRQRQSILGLWLISLAVFYLLWFGGGATGQSYYNLPALVPLCALFGLGMREILAKKWFHLWPQVAAVSAGTLVLLPVIPVYAYLFQQDRPLLAASRWARDHTPPDALILFRLNHRSDMTEYPYNAAPAYYSERRTFVCTKSAREITARGWLEKTPYAIITTPPLRLSTSLAVVDRFRRAPSLEPEAVEWLEQSGFHRLTKQDGFEVFGKE